MRVFDRTSVQTDLTEAHRGYSTTEVGAHTCTDLHEELYVVENVKK